MLMKLTPGDDLPLTLGPVVKPKPLFVDRPSERFAGLTPREYLAKTAPVRWVGDTNPLTWREDKATHGDLAHPASPAPAWAKLRHAEEATKPPAARMDMEKEEFMEPRLDPRNYVIRSPGLQTTEASRPVDILNHRPLIDQPVPMAPMRTEPERKTLTFRRWTPPSSEVHYFIGGAPTAGDPLGLRAQICRGPLPPGAVEVPKEHYEADVRARIAVANTTPHPQTVLRFTKPTPVFEEPAMMLKSPDLGYEKRDGQLHLINNSDRPVTFALDDGRRVIVEPGSRQAFADVYSVAGIYGGNFAP